MSDRPCHTCRSKMGPGEIRQRDPRTGELVCPTCLNHPITTPNRTDVNAISAARNILRQSIAKTTPPMQVVAHDGGDGKVVRHCFSCGSGGVAGRSDGTVECSFCGTVFTVQVQPRNPHSPQTINGQPVHIPGMPEESPVTPSTGEEQPVDAPEGEQAPGFTREVPGIEDADLTEYMTATGARLPRKHYAQHLALAMTPIQDRAKVQGVIREANSIPSAYCMRCTEEDLPTSFLCRRPGQEFIDHGPDHDPDLARYEGICIRCCEHNHG